MPPLPQPLLSTARPSRHRSRTVALALALSALVGAARADDSVDEAAEAARRRWVEGVRAAARGEHEAARVAFLQAWALKPLPEILQTLGETEVRTGAWVEAARHLAAFLARADVGTADERARAARLLAEAEAHVGRLLVAVDRARASVAVDGERLGTSPLGPAPLHVGAGEHVVRAELPGLADATRVVAVGAGKLERVSLAFGDATPAPGASATPPAAPRATGLAAWRTPVVVGTGALALVALGTGVVLHLRALDAGDDARALRDGLATPSACSGPGAPAPCTELAAAVDRRDGSSRLAGGAFVTAGALGVATLAAYWLWPRAAARVSVAPLADAAGVEARLTF